MAEKQIPDEIRAATSAQIAALIGEFQAKDRAALEEIITIEKAQQLGGRTDAPLPQNVIEARKLAAKLMNGHAPAYFEGKLSAAMRISTG